jgi:hypothetical protein
MLGGALMAISGVITAMASFWLASIPETQELMDLARTLLPEHIVNNWTLVYSLIGIEALGIALVYAVITYEFYDGGFFGWKLAIGIIAYDLAKMIVISLFSILPINYLSGVVCLSIQMVILWYITRPETVAYFRRSQNHAQ